MNGEKIDVYLGYKASADAKMGWEAGTLTKEEFEEFFNVTNLISSDFSSSIFSVIIISFAVILIVVPS